MEENNKPIHLAAMSKFKNMLSALWPLATYTPSELAKQAAAPTLDDGSFETFGLMAERRPDGTMACNMHIVGGQGGQSVTAQWEHRSDERLFLALTVVLRMCAYPTDQKAPLTPFMTKSYREQSYADLQLDCGTHYQPKHLKLARLFEDQFLRRNGDPDVLSVPYDKIEIALRIYIQELYPERAAKV
jgi:hypothetical protein